VGIGVWGLANHQSPNLRDVNFILYKLFYKYFNNKNFQ